MPAALEIRELVKRYGDLTAVDRLSFEVPAGRVLALLGPNGAGKTTTVEVCEGFLRADGGEVRVLGMDPATDSAHIRHRLGVMPQGGGAYPSARAGEMLRLVASYYADPHPPEELLDLVGLREAAGTPYRRLSGGQQQRLSLALAIVGRPELVFLDEPTAGLDPQARQATWDVVRALRADGVAVVLTTHYLEEAERLADQVVIIDHGRSVASGTPAELTATSTDSLRLRTSGPIDTQALLAALPTGPRVRTVTADTCVIEGTIEPSLIAAVTSWCVSQDLLVLELRTERRTLEDVFLDLTGRELRA